jgi:tetratricopeptide (TPR) repeat protein
MYYLGSLYDKNKQTDKALGIMKRIIDLNPNNPNALNYIGYSYAENEEKLHEAKSLITKALEILPNDPYITGSLGWIYYKMGNYKQALIHLEKAKMLLQAEEKMEPIVLEHLAEVYQRMGLKNKVKETYNTLLSSGIPDDKRQIIKNRLKSLNEQTERMPASINTKKK